MVRRSDDATLTIPSREGKQSIGLIADAERRILTTSSGSLLDRERFLALRDRQGAAIFADDPAVIRRILRLAASERGVFPR